MKTIGALNCVSERADEAPEEVRQLTVVSKFRSQRECRVAFFQGSSLNGKKGATRCLLY